MAMQRNSMRIPSRNLSKKSNASAEKGVQDRYNFQQRARPTNRLEGLVTSEQFRRPDQPERNEQEEELVEIEQPKQLELAEQSKQPSTVTTVVTNVESIQDRSRPAFEVELLSKDELLDTRDLNKTRTKKPLATAALIESIRFLIISAIALFFLRPRNQAWINRMASRRRILVFVLIISKLHLLVLYTRSDFIIRHIRELYAEEYDASLWTHLPHLPRLFYVQLIDYLKMYFTFELVMYVLRLISRRIRDDIPSCVAETKMRKSLYCTFLAMRLADESEMERRSFFDEVAVGYDSRIEKGVSGPYRLAECNACELREGIRNRTTKPIPISGVFALSYSHQQHLEGDSLSRGACESIIHFLRNEVEGLGTFYIWSDITLAKNIARESWDVDGLMPYLCYPTLRLDCGYTFFTQVERDIAIARNQYANCGTIEDVTRALIDLRRRHFQDGIMASANTEEDESVKRLLCKLRAVSLGMQPERGMAGIQMIANAMLIVGSYRKNQPIVRSFPNPSWHGVHEFVEEAKYLEQGLSLKYLRLAVSTRVQMFGLHVNEVDGKMCYAFWTYADQYGDMLCVGAKMFQTQRNQYRVLKKFRMVCPQAEQSELLELHMSTTAAISKRRMQDLLGRGAIYVNAPNVPTQRMDYQALSIV